MYVGAFDGHRKKRRYSRDKLQEWKDALYKGSFYAGEVIKHNDDEMRLSNKIVNIVLKEIHNVPLEKDALYKGSFYAGEVIKHNDDEMRLSNKIVNIVLKEIHNVPLEFAKHPVGFNEVVKEFENTVQHADVDEGVQIVGKAILKRHLRSFRALIVMDDLDHADQFDALLPKTFHYCYNTGMSSSYILKHIFHI
ncbi:hypothetical protein SUGI_1125020 [Cryptomeria japonica]|nr:hypothetical protein SUGI_1125020 [Cryptomeria japonica]